MYRWQHLELITRQRVVGIVRATGAAEAERMARACLATSLRVVEISLTTPNALEAIHTIAHEHPDALIGAGTVLDAASARAAVAAGARFLVSPSLHRDVIKTAHRHGASAIPGVATPTEAIAAVTAGADAVKLFPASQWTPRSFRDMRTALPQIPFVPTGGITPAHAPDWIAAGAIAVGIGASITAGAPEEAVTRVDELLTALA
ncbi:bifunctional 4-hydroxy-2-oxoglutarate aldolase/2-dehydro-3-deoxy-phosphogluconate aldolase (plasmid) [Embleya sp. NBC_00888]|uniref:bifunctional 4-hydroxy-2-oxoglutarate aldolase/2-dehydro-3-deoxy-phosphogluconate aldolase n=1 Tax=Embleya sp. NBC_00888 TaxID=2975960 RepID=UPI002F916FE0|nr:bifunctional 4-hydroxy-2-oxoglutarate aldolase/2-dehydro-3-deoxy-phosphogluconate aldolase [Embleya sp. NBC_00888]